MSELSQPGAGRPVPAPAPAGRLDAQILATWHALLVNPDLDPRHARYAIDRLLDQRACRATILTRPAPPSDRTLLAGSPAQHSVLAEVLAILL